MPASLITLQRLFGKGGRNKYFRKNCIFGTKPTKTSKPTTIFLQKQKVPTEIEPPVFVVSSMRVIATWKKIEPSQNVGLRELSGQKKQTTIARNSTKTLAKKRSRPDLNHNFLQFQAIGLPHSRYTAWLIEFEII